MDTPQEVCIEEAVLSAQRGDASVAEDVCTVFADPFHFLIKVSVPDKVWTVVVDHSRRRLLDTEAPKDSQHGHGQQPRPLRRKSGVSTRHHDASFEFSLASLR